MGTPIRDEIFSGSAQRAKQQLGIKNNLPSILVTGGSLGAKAINDCMYECLPELSKKYNIIHLSGKSGDKTKQAVNYYQMEFCDNIADLYALCEVIVSRAGANTTAEIHALGKKCILIPLPKGTSRGDQVLNAEYYEKKGATVLPQQNLTPSALIDLISVQVNSPPRSAAHRSNNEEISKAIYDIAHYLSSVSK
jgi:UDP-N-acetylglucosamine--N-acetylmuramyl-(pentapeptide) pyrophosphoryl-undecaprenol N-acetylglucosamine transferase